MQRKHIAVSGVFTLAAAVVIAGTIAVSGGSSPTEQRDTTPAGQVEDLPQPVEPTTSTKPPATPAQTRVPNNAPAPADDEPVNQPADDPGEQPPPPGVPYDSDGGEVVPNPPDMAPGEVAPRPPNPAPPAPLPPEPGPEPAGNAPPPAS